MTEVVTKSLFELKNGTYDRLKWVVQIFMPAVAVLYAALGLLWGLPLVEPVIGTVSAVALFGGTLLGLSKKSFDDRAANSAEDSFDGNLVLDESDPETDRYNLEVTIPINEIKNRSNINLKIIGVDEFREGQTSHE